MLIHFVLIGEGSSDDGLIPHLEALCIQAGADEVTGVALDFRRLPHPVGRTVEARLRSALVLEPGANLIFVHRDADGRESEPRYQEVLDAVAACGCDRSVICVVPVQETEAWLLLDGDAIRRAVGRPNDTTALQIPAPEAVERLAHPKERLKELLVQASGATGRRLDRIRRDFPRHRRALLQDLAIGGALERLASWRQLRADIVSLFGD
jgi:hypothetical protein